MAWPVGNSGEQAVSWLDRFLCGLTRHQPTMRQAKDGRLYLRCACGWESPGWQVTPLRPLRKVVPWRWVRDARERKRA